MTVQTNSRALTAACWEVNMVKKKRSPLQTFTSYRNLARYRLTGISWTLRTIQQEGCLTLAEAAKLDKAKDLILDVLHSAGVDNNYSWRSRTEIAKVKYLRRYEKAMKQEN
jgi:hypothetical protein